MTALLIWLKSLPTKIFTSLDVILLAIALTVAAFMVWPGWLQQARESGALTERVKWQAEQDRAEAKRDRERIIAQGKVDDAEQALLDARIKTALQVNGLTQIIAEERAKDATCKPSDNNCCSPMPDRVRDAINAIGRR
jgi:hypothetical protein